MVSIPGASRTIEAVMYDMWDHYFVAERSDMIIRIVEPVEFIGRTVTERRPLVFPSEVKDIERDHQCTFEVFLAVCLLFVVAFGGLVACGLDLLQGV